MTAELHTLTGAYALDSVPEGDRAEFERHLEECAACRQEVAELRATGARLAAAVAVDPPPELRVLVLADVARTRQLPPKLRNPHGPARQRPDGAENGRGEGWPPDRGTGKGQAWPRGRDFGGEGWPPDRGELGDTPSWLRGKKPGPAKAFRLRVALLGAAAAAVVAVGVGVVTTTPPAPVNSGLSADSVLSAPDATAVQGAGQGSATLVVSRSRNQAVLLASGLPALDTGHVYQVWLIRAGEAHSAGLLRPRMLMADLPPGIDRIGITVEPAGGSPGPTTPAVTRISLT
ncbi:anti-sigma factor domain-containing protein [Amycolatopsis sp. cmx-4-68]|uniref:anti-sigma factor n=1 Tax=Amycolatopsis sp. cmx-4-68 TaxID=2790938 RepID=UPI0039792D1D